jgi:hypothetical protein
LNIWQAENKENNMTAQTIHHCERSLENLLKMRNGLYKAESTEDNLKKIRALESQIERHKKVKKAEKAEK